MTLTTSLFVHFLGKISSKFSFFSFNWNFLTVSFFIFDTQKLSIFFFSEQALCWLKEKSSANIDICILKLHFYRKFMCILWALASSATLVQMSLLRFVPEYTQPTKEAIQKFLDVLHGIDRFVVLTGAGISTESGFFFWLQIN